MEIQTFGDVRKIILGVILALRKKEMSVERGMAIAANIKVLNDNMQVEINAAKLSIAATKEGMSFGEVVRMGTRTVVDGSPLIEEEQL